MKILLENNNYYVLIISFIFSIFTYFMMKFSSKLFPQFFGICESNNKTSMFHLPMIRGLGIFFPVVLIISTFLVGTILSFFEIFIIMISTLIGFWDDKFTLSYKEKLIFFLCLGSIFSFDVCSNEILQSFSLLKFLLNLFFFVFLILFFNQIDGINGLASVTFLIVLFFLFLFGANLILFLPLIFSILIYFFINMRGKIGIQGDAGSFFMGSFIAVLLINSLDYTQYGLIFFIISPIIFDVCSTTMIKFCYGTNLTIGHRDNLYQRLVFKFKNHTLITLSFAFLQIITCLLLIYLLEIFPLFEVYSLLLVLGLALTFLFCYIANAIQKKIIFK